MALLFTSSTFTISSATDSTSFYTISTFSAVSSFSTVLLLLQHLQQIHTKAHFLLVFYCFHFKLRQSSIFPNCPCLVTYTLLCHKHVPLSHHSLNILFLYSLTGSSSSSNGLLLQKHSITTLLTSLFHIIIFIISFFKCCFDTIICQAFNLRPEQMKEYVLLFIDVIFQIERTFQST